mmetsp:Transcript_44451/g.78709  ORF Transcript_44451/g.78709 Transcript_44451/m.78709 type:complete len:252 (+) Transcript_44451:33-788(+)
MSVTVSELFTDYETDFQRLRQDIEEQLRQARRPAEHLDVIQQCICEAEKSVSEAEKALRQMEMEARTLSPEQKSTVEPRLKQYRSELGEQRKVLSNCRQEAQRQLLLDEGLGTKAYRDRERLLNVDSSLRRSSSHLDEAHRQALETEQIGIDVMSDLRQQRDVILRTTENVHEIGDNVGAARRLLEAMGRRAMMNKLLLYVAVGFMGLMLIGLLWFSLETKDDSAESAGEESPMVPEQPMMPPAAGRRLRW